MVFGCRRTILFALAETLYKEGNLSRLVVIHLGGNHPFEGPVFDDVTETLFAHVGE